MRKCRTILSFLLVIAMVATLMPNIAVKATSSREDEITVVYWNPVGGADSNSGTSKEDPVASIDEAMRIASDGATIYCMNTCTLTKDTSVGSEYKSVTIKRYKSLSGEIFLADGYALTLNNITIDGVHDMKTSPVIVVDNGGCFKIDEGVTLVDSSYIEVRKLQVGISPIVFLKCISSSTEYKVTYTDENAYTTGNIFADGSIPKYYVGYNLNSVFVQTKPSNKTTSNINNQITVIDIPEDQVKGTTIYVSRYGSDGNTGLVKEKPVKTLEYALTRLKKYLGWKISGTNAPITVLDTINITEDTTLTGDSDTYFREIKADESLGSDPLINVASGVALTGTNIQLTANSSTDVAINLEKNATFTITNKVPITGIIELKEEGAKFTDIYSNTLSYHVDVAFTEKRGMTLVKNVNEASLANYTFSSLDNDSVVAYYKNRLVVTKKNDVYYDGSTGSGTGSDSNSGLTIDKPVDSLKQALKICEGDDSSWSKKNIVGLNTIPVDEDTEIDHGVQLLWFDNDAMGKYDLVAMKASLTIKNATVNGSISTNKYNSSMKLTLDDPEAKVTGDFEMVYQGNIVVNQGSIKGIEGHVKSNITIGQGHVEQDVISYSTINLTNGAGTIGGNIYMKYNSNYSLGKIIINDGADLGDNQYSIYLDRIGYSTLSSTPLVYVQGTSTFPALEHNFHVLNLDDFDAKISESDNNLGLVAKKSTTNVYMSGEGNDENDGTSYSNAVKSIERVKELLLDGHHDGMNIVICKTGYEFTSEATWDLSGLSWTPIVKISPSLLNKRVFGVYDGGNLTLKNISFDCQCLDGDVRKESLIFAFSSNADKTVWPKLHMEHVSINNTSYTTNDSLISVTSSDYVTIKDVQINGADNGLDSVGNAAAIKIRGLSTDKVDNYSENIVIQDTTFDNYFSSAIFIYQCKQVLLDNCDVKNIDLTNKSSEIHELFGIDFNTQKATVKNCDITGVIDSVFGMGIRINSSQVNVENCKIKGNKLGYGIGEYASSYDTNTKSYFDSYLYVDQNTEISDNSGSGIRISGSSYNDASSGPSFKADIYAQITNNGEYGLYTDSYRNATNEVLDDIDINFYGTIKNNGSNGIYDINNSVLTIKDGAVIDNNGGSGIFIDTYETGRTTSVIMDGGCIRNHGKTINGVAKDVVAAINMGKFNIEKQHIDDYPTFVMNGGEIYDNYGSQAGAIYETGYYGDLMVINGGKIYNNGGLDSSGSTIRVAGQGKPIEKLIINGGVISGNQDANSSIINISYKDYLKITDGMIYSDAKDVVDAIRLESVSNFDNLELAGNRAIIEGTIAFDYYSIKNSICISKPFSPQGNKYEVNNVTIKPYDLVTDASQYRNYFSLTPSVGNYCLGKSGYAIDTMPVCFVNGVTGSDDNDGLTADKAFKTISKAQDFATTNATLTTAYVNGTITVDDAQTWSSSLLNIERYTGQRIAGKKAVGFNDDMVQVANGGDLTLSETTLLGNTGGADGLHTSGTMINNEGKVTFAAATTNTLLGNLRANDQVQIIQNGIMNLGGTICMDGTTRLLNNKEINVLATGFTPTTGTTLNIEAQDDSTDRVMVRYPTEEMTNSENIVLSDDQAAKYLLANGSSTGTLILLSKNLVYVDTEQGDDNLDGTTKENAVASYAKAYELLATEGGSIYSLHTTQIDSSTSFSGTTDGMTTILSGKISIHKDSSMDAASPLFNVKNGATLTLNDIHLQGTQQDNGALVLTEQGSNVELLDNAKVSSIKSAGQITVSGSGIKVANGITLDNSTTGNTPYIEIRGDGTDNYYMALALQKPVKDYELVRYTDELSEDVLMSSKMSQFYLSEGTNSFYVKAVNQSIVLKQREKTFAVVQEPSDQLLERDDVMSTTIIFADTENISDMNVTIKRNGTVCGDVLYVVNEERHRMKIYTNSVLVGEYEIECIKDDYHVKMNFTVSSYYVTYHNDYNQLRLKNSFGNNLNYDQATIHVTSGYSQNRTLTAASFDMTGDFNGFDPTIVDTIDKTTKSQFKGELTGNTTLTAKQESEHIITLYNSDGITDYCKGTVSVSPLQIKNGNEICTQTTIDMPVVTLQPQKMSWSSDVSDGKATSQYSDTVDLSAKCSTNPKSTISYKSEDESIAKVLDTTKPTVFTSMEVGKVNIIASVPETETYAEGILVCELTVDRKKVYLQGHFGQFADMTYCGKNDDHVDNPTSGGVSISGMSTLTPVGRYFRETINSGSTVSVYFEPTGLQGTNADKYVIDEYYFTHPYSLHCGWVNVKTKRLTLQVPENLLTKTYDGTTDLTDEEIEQLAPYLANPEGVIEGDDAYLVCNGTKYRSSDVGENIDIYSYMVAGEDKANYGYDYVVTGSITQATPKISLANTKTNYSYLEQREPIRCIATFGQNEVAGTFSYVDGPTQLTQDVTQKWKFTSDNANIKSVEGAFDIKVTGTKQVLSFEDEEAQSGSKTINLTDGVTTIAATNSAIEGTPITYTSSNPLVATVNASTGAITPLKKGTITISVDTPEKVGYYAGHSEFTLTIDRWVVANIVWNTATFADMTYCGKDDVSIEAPESGGPTLSNAPGITPIIKYQRAYSNAGDDVTVTAEVTGFTGTDAADYRLPTISYNANYAKVNVKKQKTSLDLSNVKLSKVYDGTADLTTQQIKALKSSMPSPSNIVAGDQVTVDVSKVAYVSAQAGAKKYVKGFALSGDDVDNYDFTEPNDFTAEIKKAIITVTYVGDKIKVGEIPTFGVKVTGFVHGETAETAASYAQPTVTGGDSAKAGTYKLSPIGGFAINYDFVYVAGNLVVVAETSELNESNIIFGNESDVKGSLFSLLQAKATKITKTQVTVKWKKVSGAAGYMVYTSRCGKNQTPKKVATLSAGKTSYTQTKLKKSYMYKYIIAAYKVVNGKNQIITISKTIHIITVGSKKLTNAISIKTNKSSVSLKVNKSFKLKLSEVVPKKKKINIHRKICC